MTLLTTRATLLSCLLCALGCAESHGRGDDGGAAVTDGPVSTTPPGARADRSDWAARRPCTGARASFVAPDGDCRGHTPCFSALQDAVDAASDGATVWVFPGTYTSGEGPVLVATESLVCVRSVGGPEVTILDGRSRDTVVRAGYAGALWLEGFTVTGCGDADRADVLDGQAVAIGGWDELRGWIVGNVFEGNVDGVGVILFSTSTVSAEADVYVSGNVIRGNRTTPAEYNAVIDFDDLGLDGESGLVRVENNLIVDNEGNGIQFAQALSRASDTSDRRVEVIHNTVVGNEVGLVAPVENVFVHDNIIVENEMDVARLDQPTDRSVRNNWFSDAPGFVGTDENRDGPVGFVDASAGDYRLREDSPARGAGTPSAAAELDLEGRPRDPSAPDVGAYESSAD